MLQAAAALERGTPAEALELLAERRRRFGETEHAGPAGLVELEALRRLGQVDQALARLDVLVRQGQFPAGRHDELPLIRAELLAAAHRCDDAVPLFEQLAAHPRFSARAQAGLDACSPVP